MNIVAGRIILRETGKGVRDLTVVLLDVEQSAYHVFGSGDLVGEPSSVMNDLPVRRLGSAISDAQGRFSIEYTSKAKKRARPNLAVMVLTSEMAGRKGYPSILHASCDIRTAAGENENYLIVLTKTSLYQGEMTEFGVSGSVTWPVETLGKLEKVREAWHDDSPVPKLSEVYREKFKILEDARAKSSIPERGFRLSLPMISNGDDGQTRVVFDRESKKWFMNKGEEKTEIGFAGTVLASDLKAEERPSAGIGVVLDEDKQEFRLVVANPVFSLRVAETGPGKLFMENLKKRYRQAQG